MTPDELLQLMRILTTSQYRKAMVYFLTRDVSVLRNLERLLKRAERYKK